MQLTNYMALKNLPCTRGITPKVCHEWRGPSPRLRAWTSYTASKKHRSGGELLAQFLGKSLLMLEVLGSISGPVKSDIVSPMARHRYDVLS